MSETAHPPQPILTQTTSSDQVRIYRAIANASSDPMLTAAPAQFGAPGYSITFVNESFARLVGQSPEHIVGQPLTFLTTFTAPTSTLSALWQAIDEERTVTISWDCLTHSGKIQASELSLIAIGDPSNPAPSTLEPNGTCHYLIIVRPTVNSTAHELLDAEALENIQHFIDSLQVGIMVFDTVGTVVAANRYLQRQLSEDYGLDITVGKAIGEQVRARLGVCFPQDFYTALHGEPARREIMLQTSDNQTRWFDTRFNPVCDESGTVRFIAFLGLDITANKQIEDALAISLQRYHIAIQNAKAGVWDWNLQSGEFYVDPSTRAVLGYFEDEIPNNLAAWIRYIHPEDREHVIALARSHVEGKTDEYHVEYRMMHRDGTFHWVLAAGKAIRDQNNHTVRLVGTAMDITERKMVEAALQTSEGRFQAVWQASPEAMVLLDSNGNVILANPAYYALSGGTPAEVLGQPSDLVIPPKFHGEPFQEYLSLFETGILPKHTVSELQSANGELKTVEVSAELIRYEGQSVAIFSTIRDITVRNEAEATLKRHARQAEALTRSSQLMLRPANNLAEQEECLRSTLSTLLRGLDGDYLALCKFGNSKSHISPNFCLEVVSPESLEAHADSDQIPLNATMHLSPQLLQRVMENGRASASADEVTTGILTGTFSSFHVERVSTNAGPWGFVTFGTRDQRGVWKSEELWIIQTAVEMIGNVLQRWEAEAAVRAAQASLEQQVQQRTAMLFQTVESLQRQINERKRAEIEVRRRLNTERALRDISGRLMKATDFDHAAAATLADIGERLVSDKVLLLRLQSESHTFVNSHRWLKSDGNLSGSMQELPAKQIRHLLKHLQEAGFLLLSQKTAGEAAISVEAALFQAWFSESMLMLPLHVSGELAALLICCDAERLREDQEEGIHFVQAAVGMLSGMLRIDQMMNTLERRVAEQTDELAAFFNMAVLASGSEHAIETLAAALTMVKEIGNCDAVCVHIMSPDGAALQLAYQVGLDKIDHKHLLRLPRESTIYQRIARNSTPILVTEYNPIMLETQVGEFKSYFGAPMAVRHNVQGLLSCYWRFVHSVSLNQMSLLTALTDQLGIILENQRLHRHAQEVGVVHERQRLARELHDSVTQTMYGVMIFARAAREALEDNAFERLADCLNQVEGASLRSLKEMRLLLYQLRPLALESQGVVEAIRNRVELVERRLGVEVDIQMTPIVGLSHSVEEAIYHIVMESLNNILKHADADRVAIYLQLAGTHAELRVTDDGVGFELDQVMQGMGLSNMHERINALGGELRIQTHIDEGTSILVQIPIG